MPEEDLSEGVKLVARAFSLSPEDAEFVERRLKVKDQVRRMGKYLSILGQLLAEGPALVQGGPEERKQDWRKCVEAVESLWRASCCLWTVGHHAPATALAISTLEETGKLAVERMRLEGVGKLVASEREQAFFNSVWPPRRSPFRDHFTKHVMAATAGALVNSRIDRIFTLEFVAEFLDMVDKQELEKLRQRCLYLDRDGAELHLPHEAITRENAARYIALAGEILAEIIPDPKEHQRLLGNVQTFEKEAGLPVIEGSPEEARRLRRLLFGP